MTVTPQPPPQVRDGEAVWITDMGAWFPGERVVLRGRDLFTELRDMSWMELLLLGITNRRHDPRQLRLFNGIWVIATSYPDPRIWNNGVSALAGSARSTASLAIAAATAVSEATIYGHRPLTGAMHLLRRVATQQDAGLALPKILRNILREARCRKQGHPGAGKQRAVAVFPGYGRPLVRRDERIDVLLGLAQELGFGGGRYLSLVAEIEKNLPGLGLELAANAGIYMAALAADQHMSTREFCHYVTLCFSSGFMCCYIDALNHDPGSFFPIPCSAINYVGTSSRSYRGNPV